MKYEFLNIFLDSKEILTQTKKKINPFLLENNSAQIEKIYQFYKSDTNLLFVNGFIGTGKAEVVNYSTSFLSPETIVLKYNCFNSTVLDDILLSFFVEFKKLSAQNAISEPKIKTENFTQKVNSYFAQIEKPFVVILDSFGELLDENRQEIIDFILHLNSMSKVKVIIIGRTFESKYFNDVSVERVTTLAFDREIFEKFLKSEKIKVQTGIYDEFYKHTKGYYFITALSLKILQSQNITLVDFLANLKNSYLPFSKFIEKQSFNMVQPDERNLFLFLCLIRHPVSLKLLEKLKFCSKEKIKPLMERLIILQDGENVYVQDYLKDEIENSTSPNILHKIRQYIVDLYSTQLPLKPLERDISISRQTMRKEIDFHSLFLPKKPKKASQSVDINYLSYSRVFEMGDKQKPEETKMESSQAQVQPESPMDLTQRKNIHINIDNLPFQRVNSSLSSIQKTKEIQDENLSFKDIIIRIKQAEKLYQYSDVVELCKLALKMKEEKEYQTYLPLFYSKIAYSYKKMAEYEHSLNYYNLAEELYQKLGNFARVNRIKYSIANIFYDTYRQEKARDLFNEIIKSPDSDDILIVKSYMKLANMEEDSSVMQKASEYYKLALEHSDTIEKIDVLSELYFKYALILDDQSDIPEAIEYYNKCINLTTDMSVNKFLSPAYSNIATLYFENNDAENAILNYTKSYEIDKENNNVEGIYDTSSKLASMLRRKDPEKSLEYYTEALRCAKEINDVFYIISASLEIGDYHYDKKQDEIALKYYITAYALARNNLSSENLQKINTRLNDLKFRLGNEKFENLAKVIVESDV